MLKDLAGLKGPSGVNKFKAYFSRMLTMTGFTNGVNKMDCKFSLINQEGLMLRRMILVIMKRKMSQEATALLLMMDICISVLITWAKSFESNWTI